MYNIIYKYTHRLPIQLHSQIWSFTKPLHLSLYNLVFQLKVDYHPPQLAIPFIFFSKYLLILLTHLHCDLPLVFPLLYSILPICLGILTIFILLTWPNDLSLLVFYNCSLCLYTTIPFLCSSFLTISQFVLLLMTLINVISQICTLLHSFSVIFQASQLYGIHTIIGIKCLQHGHFCFF